MAAETLTPTCRWAQNKNTLFFTVELTDVKEPTVNICEDSIDLKGFGNGAQGENFYQVHLDLMNVIDAQKSKYVVKERNIQFFLCKKDDDHCFWNRLQKAEVKPAWLRIDFDRWEPEEDPEPPVDEDVEKVINSITLENKVRKQVESAKSEIKGFIRLAYLSIYNITQGIAFTCIFFMLLISLAKQGTSALYTAFDDVGHLLITCQLFAILEIVNPLIGIVNTGPVAPIMQVGGRNFILFGVILLEKQLHTNPLVFALFLAWSAIEVIRYPFYALSLFQKSLKWLTYLRYTAWIVLFPAGVLTEALIILTAIPLFAASEKLSVRMPNLLNFGCQYSFFLTMYVGLLVCGGLYQCRHLMILRSRKLNPRRREVKRD